MCKGSVHARKTVDAREGEQYQVSDGGHPGYQIGVLHTATQGRQADGAIACAACIRTPTNVTLTGLPPAMQQRFQVGPTANAVFVPNEAAPANMQDVIEFANGNAVPLIAFANTPVRFALAVAASQADERPRETVAA